MAEFNECLVFSVITTVDKIPDLIRDNFKHGKQVKVNVFKNKIEFYITPCMLNDDNEASSYLESIYEKSNSSASTCSALSEKTTTASETESANDYLKQTESGPSDLQDADETTQSIFSSKRSGTHGTGTEKDEFIISPKASTEETDTALSASDTLSGLESISANTSFDKISEDTFEKDSISDESLKSKNSSSFIHIQIHDSLIENQEEEQAAQILENNITQVNELNVDNNNLSSANDQTTISTNQNENEHNTNTAAFSGSVPTEISKNDSNSLSQQSQLLANDSSDSDIEEVYCSFSLINTTHDQKNDEALEKSEFLENDDSEKKENQKQNDLPKNETNLEHNDLPQDINNPIDETAEIEMSHKAEESKLKSNTNLKRRNPKINCSKRKEVNKKNDSAFEDVDISSAYDWFDSTDTSDSSDEEIIKKNLNKNAKDSTKEFSEKVKKNDKEKSNTSPLGNSLKTNIETRSSSRFKRILMESDEESSREPDFSKRKSKKLRSSEKPGDANLSSNWKLFFESSDEELFVDTETKTNGLHEESLKKSVPFIHDSSDSEYFEEGEKTQPSRSTSHSAKENKVSSSKSKEQHVFSLSSSESDVSESEISVIEYMGSEEECEENADISSNSSNERSKKKQPVSKKNNEDEEDSTEKNDKKTSKKSAKNSRSNITPENMIETSEDESEDETYVNLTKKGRRRNVVLETETRKATQEERNRIKKVTAHKEYIKTFLENLPEDETNTRLILEIDEKTKKVLVEVDPSLVSICKPHQREGIRFLYNNVIASIEDLQQDKGSGCILAHNMGLGKTFQTIAFLHTLLTNKNTKDYIQRVLVVVPLNTVGNWANEFRLWLEERDLFTFPLFEYQNYRTEYERKMLLREWLEEGGVCIISHGQLVASLKEKKKASFRKLAHRVFFTPGPDVLIIDEAHLIKNEKTSINHVMCEIRTPRKIALTGTPLQNNLKEYYTMCQFIKPNLLGSKSEFTARFEEPIRRGQLADASQEDYRIMQKRSHVLHKLLEGTMQRFSYQIFSQYLTPKHEYVVAIQLSDLQRQIYERFVEKYYEGVLHESPLIAYRFLETICIHPALLLTMKGDFSDTCRELMKDLLSQIETQEYELNNKIRVFFSLLEESELVHDKVVVFTQRRSMLDMLERLLHENAIKREANKNCILPFKTWKKDHDYFRIDGNVASGFRDRAARKINMIDQPQARLLLASTKACGLGINLIGANRCILMDACWNPAVDLQAIYRIYRFGQPKTVYVYRLISYATFEERVYDRQVLKESISKRIIDENHLKRTLKNESINNVLKYRPAPPSDKPVPIVPKDTVLATILHRHKELIWNYHEHDSLLENKPEEQLTEEERENAWKEFERDREESRVPPPQPEPTASTSTQPNNEPQTENSDNPKFVHQGTKTNSKPKQLSWEEVASERIRRSLTSFPNNVPTSCANMINYLYQMKEVQDYSTLIVCMQIIKFNILYRSRQLAEELSSLRIFFSQNQSTHPEYKEKDKRTIEIRCQLQSLATEFSILKRIFDDPKRVGEISVGLYNSCENELQKVLQVSQKIIMETD